MAIEKPEGYQTPRNDYSTWAKKEGESLVDYYGRLSANREGGILGTSGLMDRAMSSVKAKGDEELGEESVKAPTCPVGYKYDPASGTCVKISSSSDRTPSNREMFEESHRGKILGEAMGADEAWEAEKLQGSVDRLTGKSPVLDDALAFLLPGGSLLSALKKGDTEALRDYIGSDKDAKAVYDSLKATGMTDEEVARNMGSREKLGWMHGVGMADSLPTQDWVADDKGIMDTIGSRLGGSVMSLFGMNSPYQEQTSRQADITRAMTAGQRGSMFGGADWNANNNSLMTGRATIAPSFAVSSGNNWDPGLFSQSYAQTIAEQEAKAQGLMKQVQTIEAAEAAKAKAEAAAAAAAAARSRAASSGVSYGSNSWSDSSASWDNSGSSYSFSSSPSYSSTSLTSDSSSGYAG
jgi:hypothetical protein